MRPCRPPRHLRLLPRREAFVEFGERLLRLGFEPLDLVSNRDVAARLHGAQLLDLLFELADRFFEVEVGAHRASIWERNQGNCRAAAKLAAGSSQVKKTALVQVSPSGCRSRTMI